MPVFTIVDWDESDPRPHSDDLVLTDLWLKAECEAALKKAEAYSGAKNMSKWGIRNWLTSKPNLFSLEAAQYAVDNMKADWKANALQKAQSCRRTFISSSKDIRSRLISVHERFTEEEADYAVSHLS